MVLRMVVVVPDRPTRNTNFCQISRTVRLQLADEVAPDMTSSMHHDLERGNRLEVRWLAGGVLEPGRARGIPTPSNRAIADILVLHADGASGG